MNTIKFQQELIKHIVKHKEPIYIADKNIFFVADISCYFMMKIKGDELYINLQKLRKIDNVDFLDFEKSGAIPAITKDELKAWQKNTYAKFYYDKGKELFVNQKYLSYFKSPNLTYRANEKMLYIFDCGEFVGVICGARMPKEY